MTETQCQIKTITRDISVSLVDMHQFVSTLAIDIEPESYQTLKPRIFNASHFPWPLLTPSELEWVNRFKTLKKQIEWISGRYAIKSLASSRITSAGPIDTIEVGYHESGAPFLLDHADTPISISHSGRYAAGALSLDSTIAIGMDLERIKGENMDAILLVAFSDRERTLMPSPDPATLYRAWTAKEAFMKLIQKGFNESLKKIEFIDNTIIYNKIPLTDLTIHSETLDGQYAFTLIASDLAASKSYLNQ